MSLLTDFTKGIWKENPVLVLLLGTCPTLAVTSSATNGLGMGLATTGVLLGSNLVISLIAGIVPKKILIPVYIGVIATFVTIVDLLMKAYAPPALYTALGIFIPLIVVNCIVLGRAEAFASKNGPLSSVLDGLGMGLGFTLALCAMATIREILGAGTFCGMPIPWFSENPIGILTMAPGGFFVFGCMIALVNKITKGKAITKKEFGCAACPGCGKVGSCSGKEEAAK